MRRKSPSLLASLMDSRDSLPANVGHGVPEWWTRAVGVLDTPGGGSPSACPPLRALVSATPAPRVHHSDNSCRAFLLLPAHGEARYACPEGPGYRRLRPGRTGGMGTAR